MLTIFRRVTFYPNTPKCTHIQLEIILFLLVWDVIWIINDLLAPLSLLFHEFQQNSQVLFLQTKSNENNFNPCIIDYAARKSTLIGNKVITFVFVSNDHDLGRVAYNHEYTHCCKRHWDRSVSSSVFLFCTSTLKNFQYQNFCKNKKNNLYISSDFWKTKFNVYVGIFVIVSDPTEIGIVWYKYKCNDFIANQETMALMNIDGYKPKYTWNGQVCAPCSCCRQKPAALLCTCSSLWVSADECGSQTVDTYSNVGLAIVV
jgi:hypothetical protein